LDPWKGQLSFLYIHYENTTMIPQMIHTKDAIVRTGLFCCFVAATAHE
jgi:hypothetical protein